eukprot:TRINITY_DN71018_c0_g1_i1.p1 TRINITY_DN71018_c0_g1~~TRINITY_DN71018_c0_g1_i1.p1  ORF type:complete len:176 (-),score=58.04 TRINITY_DN71018_c0_g1_i1:51-578(-)
MATAGKKSNKPKTPQDKRGEADKEMELRKKIDENHARCEALERFLVIRAEQTQRSRLEQEGLRRRVEELHQKFMDEEKQLDTTHHEMYRQYKAMQGELIHRIDLLQTTINTLREELEESRLQLERTKAEKDEIIAQKNRKINEQKQKMEDMAIEFGEMLKETLEKMSNIHREPRR